MNESINDLFLGIIDEIEYPTSGNSFSPSDPFPEYQFEYDLGEENQVYSIVREGFLALGYDIENYNTKDWNPLGRFIKRGDNVLIKPNWVMHYNKNKNNPENLDCLVTHPSFVRVVIDYVLIALDGTGKIVVADAPMQGCNLQEMFSKQGYLELFEFYNQKGINLEILDLRQVRVVTKSRVITDMIEVNKIDQSIEIDLADSSFHQTPDLAKYKVSDYSADRTNTYHHNGHHIYSINKTVIESDVVINMPKPKCHRLAGITAASKNIVGTVFDKASLPHRVIGAKSEGGDEYSEKSKIKKYIAVLEEHKLRLSEKGHTKQAGFIQFFIAVLYVLVKFGLQDKVLLGSWYGNDTIWRTVADLNVILRYSNKEGIIKDTQQRKILNIADMIISGQGNGPVGPHPKDLGIVLIAEDSSYMDGTCAKIMGFDGAKIPGLTVALSNKYLSSDGIKKIKSNKKNYNDILFDDFVAEKEWTFEPHDCWKGFIES